MSTGTTPPAPNSPRPLNPILEDLVTSDLEAVKSRIKRISFGFITVLLGPIAVLLLTLQILELPKDTWQAIALISGSLLSCLPP